MSSEKGFTLIELLVVIGIVAVIAVAIVLALNPNELLKQARDSRRLADLATLNKAVAAMQADRNHTSIGTSTIVYLSLPSSSSTCGTYTLPALTGGMTYNCVTTSSVSNIDGTGWLPLNLTTLPSGSPVTMLPVDPVNSATGNRYYLYMASSTAWAFSVGLESTKYIQQSGQKDGGIDGTRFEAGSNLGLLGDSSGLIGYWTMDEGSGTVANDSSSKAAHGSIVGSPTWLSGSSCKRGSCLQFTNNKYINLTGLAVTGPETSVSFWMYWNGSSNTMPFGFDTFDLFFWNSAFGYNTGCSGVRGISSAGLANTWVYVTAVFSETQANTKMYINGVNQSLSSGGGVDSCLYRPQTTNARISGWPNSTGTYEFQGSLDDVRMYNRALTESEVTALYNASQ